MGAVPEPTRATPAPATCPAAPRPERRLRLGPRCRGARSPGTGEAGGAGRPPRPAGARRSFCFRQFERRAPRQPSGPRESTVPATASLRLPPRALPSLASLRPIGRAGRPGYGSTDSSRRWVFGVWPRWPTAQKVSPSTSPETLPLRLLPAPGGLGWEVRARPALSARGREPGARRCTQPAPGHLRVGYRYNPLLACLEAWALGSRTSAQIPFSGLERRRLGGGCSGNHHLRLLEG